MNKREQKHQLKVHKLLNDAEALIARHQLEIESLHDARIRLRNLLELPTWTTLDTEHLQALAIKVRDGNWRQYG